MQFIMVLYGIQWMYESIKQRKFGRLYPLYSDVQIYIYEKEICQSNIKKYFK